MTASEFLNWIDYFITKSVEKAEQKPCCSKGCHHCCDEVAYAEMREVDHIIAGMSPELKERAKERLRLWLVKVKPMLEKEPGAEGYIDAFEYRDLKITCPLLEDGLCSVYERRPMGCRLFMATGSPDNCAMPMRRKQTILDVDYAANEKFWKGLMGQWTFSQPGTYITDHLGVLLAERLLGEHPESTMRRIIEVVP